MQEIDKKIGQTFGMLRKSKHLTIKEVTGGDFSESQQSKFERGDSEITVSKFFSLLENSNIFLDEFRDIYNNYVDSESYTFRQELAAAYNSRDLKKSKELLNFWRSKANENPNNKFYKLNEVVTECATSYIAGSTVLKSNIEILIDYLDQVEEWGRYELWVFGNCLIFFDNNLLDYYGKIILGKTNFYQSNPVNQRMVIRTLLNLIDTWLKKGELGQALKYINVFKRVEISMDFFAEKILLEYHIGHYSYLQGHSDGVSKMKRSAQCFEDFGYSQKAKAMFLEIENIQADFHI